ncbi:MAG: response regulator transcription factor, partial [Pirellulaceae bacterium]
MKPTSHWTDVAAVVHIVDDETEVRCLLEKVVRRAAYQAITYASAGEFLQSYKPYDRECLILDLRMPGQTGLDLLRTLAGRSHDVPVLCLSGSVSIAEAVALVKLGAVDVLEKPWDQTLLLHRISVAIQICGEVRSTRGQWRRRLERLTERERQVMALLVRGEKTETI